MRVWGSDIPTQQHDEATLESMRASNEESREGRGESRDLSMEDGQALVRCASVLVQRRLCRAEQRASCSASPARREVPFDTTLQVKSESRPDQMNASQGAMEELLRSMVPQRIHRARNRVMAMRAIFLSARADRQPRTTETAFNSAKTTLAASDRGHRVVM